MRRRKIRKILVANRGEIAVRIQRTCRELDIATVAVFSEPDRQALHVRYADEAYPLLGASAQETYLSQKKILDIAVRAKADAIHPGYGFLSENAGFAEACAARRLIFIGPSPQSIAMMGEKTQARARMSRSGVPVVPGTAPLASSAAAKIEAAKLGYPVLIKAAAGGGGKGMRRVERPAELAAAFEACRREAQSAFGDGRVYLEKYLDEPHHIEFQILADTHGRTVHLYERECSIQRRHQKIIEETPSPLMTEKLRMKMGEAAIKAAQACGYTNAGTVEFMVDAERNYYFLEMNTRLQVEHPVTEMVTGIDIVERQIRIAEGGRLDERVPPMQGTAMECRIYAEDPWNNFFPSPGLVKKCSAPGGPGVRDDTGIYAGFAIPLEYDPLISKLVVRGENRGQTLARMLRAIEEYQVIGVRTNLPYLRRILLQPDFRKGRYDTHFIPRHHEELLRDEKGHQESVAFAAAAILAWLGEEKGALIPFSKTTETSAWKMSGRPGTGEK